MSNTVVDFDYLLTQVKEKKIKKPFKGRTAWMKQHFLSYFSEDQLFLIATNAKVGDIYQEHEKNHRIVEIKPFDNGEIGYIVNELGVSPCGCSFLMLPLTVHKAALWALWDDICYYDIEWFIVELQLEKDRNSILEWYTKEHTKKYKKSTAFAKELHTLFLEKGPLAIVDKDGVIHRWIVDKRKVLWQEEYRGDE